MEIYLVNINNKAIYKDLDNLKNLLIAGDVGTGKTTYFKNVIKDITSKHTPGEVKFIIFDSKGIDYLQYSESSYLLFPITSDNKINIFKEQLDKLKNISYKRLLCKEKEPAIIVIIDEIYMLAYRCMQCINDVVELAKETAKTNIHFLISSQRPSCYGIELSNVINNKMCYWLLDKKELIHFIGSNQNLDINMPGECAVVFDGKEERYQQTL